MALGYILATRMIDCRSLIAVVSVLVVVAVAVADNLIRRREVWNFFEKE